MDFNLKQWRRRQDESEIQHSVKLPKLLIEPHPHPEPNTKTNLLTPFSDPSSSSRSFPKMWGYFSLAQRQELELQAQIFRYILAGAAVPSELLQPIKKSLLQSPPCFFHHPLQPQSLCQTAYLRPGYWGRAAMDPEPGRCRRTDGKKWRCSRDVISGHKYCERHVHRGRNRSRKPVETTPTTNSISTAGVGLANVAGGTSTADVITVDSQTLVAAATGTVFGLSLPSPAVDLHCLHQSYCDSKTVISNDGKSQNELKVEAGKSDGHVLRHFFDDWPRSFQNSNDGGNSSGQMNSATSLSISTPGLPSPSDVSLKLSTGGVGGDPAPGSWGGWAAGHMASMGGPLAEALRSANSYSSPTSVLHQPPRCSASETSVVTS